jgi:hypothetical protein
MAETAHIDEEKTIEKAVWHYVGVTVLWISLLLTGMALERLGLTSNILAGILPGETGSLRNQVSEYKSKMQTTERSLDEMMRSKQALEVEVTRLKKASTPTAQ